MSTTPATRAYRSKIGRLPWAVRHELNERLRDGATGTDLLTWLNRHPAQRGKPRINSQNLSDWRTSGYADWLRDLERAHHIRTYAETAQHIATAAGGDPAAVGSRILAGRMLDMLEGAEAETAADFARAVASLRKGETDAQKLELENRKLTLAQQNLELEKQKFKRLTCETFLKWYQDKTAVEIAAGPGSNEDKIAALLAFMDHQQTL